MGSTNVTAMNKNLKNGEIASLYYFYGHDVAALESYTKMLTARLCPPDAQFMNLHKLDGKKLEISELADACEALPMFADRVVITINDLNMDAVPKDDADDIKKLLSNLSDSTTVIIYATGVDLYKNKRSLTDKNKRFADYCAKYGEVCDFAFKKASELGKSISAALYKEGCTISRQDAEYLADMCLCNSAYIKQEIDKLSAYAHGREITRKDIDELCIRHIESDGYALAINILRGNAKMVFKRLQELAAQNYEAFEVLGIIGFSLADIYRAKLARSSGISYQDAARDFKYPKNREFAVKNAYSECGNISSERIRQTLEILSQTDLRLKTHSSGRENDMLTLEQGIARSMALRC